MNRGKHVTLVSAAALLALAAARPGMADRPAAAWMVRDIGSPSIAGSTDVDASGVWTIQGSSTQLGNQADHFHFVSQSVPGDGSITARFLSMKGGHAEWSRAGLMLRANDTPGSPDVYLAMTPGHGLIATPRLVQDGESGFLGLVGPSTSQASTLFIRLQRAGNEVAGFYSRDSILWFQAGFPPQILAALTDSALLGLAVTSQQDGASTTGKLDSVQIDGGATFVYGLSSCGGDKTVLLQWRPLKNAVAYNVYRGPSGAARDALVKVSSNAVLGTSFTDNSPGLVDGTPQTYGVAAIFPGAGGNPVEGPLVAITATPVAIPAGFLGCSINEGAKTGSAASDAATGEITLRGSGVLSFDNADGFYFLNQPVTGDTQTTVRALTKASPASNWALAGLMVRESLDADSRYIAVWTTASGRLFSQWRAVTHGFAEWPGFFAIDNGTLKLPITLRLTRRGNTVTPEYSMDNGQSFQPAGQAITFDPPLGKTVYIGLAISAANRGNTSQVKFSSPEFKTPQ